MKKIEGFKRILTAKIAVLAVLLGSTAALTAQTTVSVGGISIVPNGEAQQVTISLSSSAADIYKLEGYIELPKGLKYVTVNTGLGQKAVQGTGSITVACQTTLKPSTGEFTVRNLNKTAFTGASGSVFKFWVLADNTLAEDAVITLKNVEATHTDDTPDSGLSATGKVTRTEASGDDPTPTPTPAGGVSVGFVQQSVELSPGDNTVVSLRIKNSTQPIAGLEAYLKLPTGITATVGAASSTTSSLTYNQGTGKITMVDYGDGDGYVSSAEGSNILTIVLTAGNDFTSEGTVELSKIVIAKPDASTIDCDDLSLTVKVKDNENIAGLKDAVAELQTKLDQAKATLESDYPNVDCSSTITGLQDRIDALNKKLENPATINADEIKAEIEAISADIDKLTTSAPLMSKLQKNIATAQAELDALKDYIKEKGKTNTYSSRLNEIQATINGINNELKEAFKTKDIKEATIQAEIDKVRADIAALKAVVDQELEDTIYKEWCKKISDVQAELDNVTAYVKNYCKDKDYTSDISALQTRINTVSSDLETAKSKGSISEADFTATLNTISSDIAKLKAKAAAEQSSSQSISPEITALYQSWAEKIAAVQKKLKDAVEKIRDTYPASTMEAMEPEISAVQEKLATVSSQLDDLYYSQKLTASTTFDLDSIEKAIDALTASAETKNKAINTSTYNTLKAEIDALQKQLDDTKADIKKNCDDAITTAAETDAKAVQAQIDQLKANLDALNKAGKLSADSKLDAAATKAVTDAIADMYFKAIKTQNDKAYPVLVKEIEALSDSLDTARKQIEEAYGEEIAAAMTEALDAIQKKIDEAKAALDKQHANILITKNTTVDKETILAAISKAKADAKAKAEPESPDKPDDPEDPDKPDSHSKEAQALYKALTTDLAALQRQLDNAKAEMERKYDKDIVEAGKKDFEALQKMIDEMKAKIEELYKADKLDKNTEIDKDEFAAALNKAKDATKALQAEKNYKAMTEEIAKLEAELAKAKEEVEKNAADVAEEFNLQFSLIEQLLTKLKDQVEKEQKEGMVSMNNMASADIIRNSIGNVTKDAAKREEAFQANKKLTEKLDEVDNLLNTTMEQIQKDYANVAGDFADDMARIQAMIDALRAELRQKYLDGELNANSSIDTTAIRNAITALLKAAKDAHTVGIFGITMPEGATTEMYDLNGQRISQPKKGTVVIVRMQDGKLRKMVVR